MNDNRIEALAQFLECEVGDISEDSHNANTFSCGREEYAVLTDDEADAEAKRYILDSVWAFNASFLQYHLMGDLDEKVIRHIQEKCEDSNDSLRSLLEDENDFVDEAINADGRGHFLSFYDGAENEVEFEGTTYYIYRNN